MAGLNDPKLENDSKLESQQIREEAVDVEPVLVEPIKEEAPVTDGELEALSVKQLQAVATGLGFVGAEVFEKKKQLINVINNLKARPTFNPSMKTTDKVETATESKNWQSKRDRTKAFMEKQPTVRTMIPLDLGEVRPAYAELQINGYKMIVPKGVYVNLPEPFADLVSYSYNQTAEAGKDFLLDRPGTDPETGKTVADILG